MFASAGWKRQHGDKDMPSNWRSPPHPGAKSPEQGRPYILIDAYKRHDWLVGAVDKRLREEFGKLQVEINDEKSRTVDLERGECFGFLGFEFRYLRGLSGAMRPHYAPKLKKRTALVRVLKEVFRRHRSQPIERVINLINPKLRGWVNYFAGGHSSGG